MTTLERKPALLAAVLASVALAVAIASWGGSAPAYRGDADQMAEILERLAAIELRQQRLMDASRHRAMPAASTLASEAAYTHRQRLKDDPVYSQQMEEQRLAELERQFEGEQVNPRWAGEVSTLLNDVLDLAALRSDMDVKAGTVDCRNRSCRISMEVPPESDGYEDFVTYMMTEMASVLPKARLVTLEQPDGSRSVRIFADTSPGREPEGD